MTAAESGLPVAPVAPAQPWRYVYRLPWLLGLMVFGLPVLVIALLPGLRDLGPGQRRLGPAVQLGYARWLLRALGVRLEIIGKPPAPPYLLVANHISWFDIPLLHALAPLWLVAKSGIRDWPLIGALARLVGTIFIARGNEASRLRAARRMAALLRHGRVVGVFPEAGIQAARGVGRFHARLFAPALRTGAPVLPVAIRYWRDGDIHDERVFGPGTSFLGLLAAMLARPACRGQLIIGQPLDPAGHTRSSLARAAEAEVTRMYAHEPDA